MNIVLKRQASGRTEFLVYSLKREGVGIGVRVKKITEDGRLLHSQTGVMASEKAARDRIRTMIHLKFKRQKGWERTELETLPEKVVKFLEVPPEMQVSVEEMIMILRKARDERYVYFGNVSGFEEYFDLRVEYLGYVTEDSNIVKAFDKCGTLRDCFIHRIDKMELTERAIEAGQRSRGEL